MSKYVSGVTLKRYYGFSETIMRQIRMSDAVIKCSHCTWIYDIENPVISKYNTLKEIPEHLIKDEYGNKVQISPCECNDCKAR